MKLACGVISVYLMVFAGIPNGARCHESILLDMQSKFQYGIELVHRFFNGNPDSHKIFFGAFNKHDSKGQAENERIFLKKFFTAIVRSVMGEQGNVADVGVKISVFVAKMISDAFARSGRSARESSNENNFSPLRALLQQPRIRELMRQAQDPELMENVLEYFVEEKLSAKSTDCIKLFICKLSPFVSGMQKSLKFFLQTETETKKWSGFGAGNETNFTEHGDADWAIKNNLNLTCATKECNSWITSTPLERMYFFLPNMDEFVENGDACDDRHPSCTY